MSIPISKLKNCWRIFFVKKWSKRGWSEVKVTEVTEWSNKCMPPAPRQAGLQPTLASEDVVFIDGMSLPPPQQLLCCWRQPACSRTDTTKLYQHPIYHLLNIQRSDSDTGTWWNGILHVFYHWVWLTWLIIMGAPAYCRCPTAGRHCRCSRWWPAAASTLMMQWHCCSWLHPDFGGDDTLKWWTIVGTWSAPHVPLWLYTPPSIHQVTPLATSPHPQFHSEVHTYHWQHHTALVLLRLSVVVEHWELVAWTG